MISKQITIDGMFRVFNKIIGKPIWESMLPASGFATSAVYKANGKQHVVIACEGDKFKAAPYGAYMAFTLPSSPSKRTLAV